MLDPALRSWLAPMVGEVSVVRSLVGGITGQMLQLRRADGEADIVVRRWPAERDHARDEDPSGDSRWQQGMVRREAVGLEALRGTGLPAPALIAADPDGSASGRPTTVTTFLPGRVELSPPDLRSWVRSLAEMLVRIHAVPPPELAACELWASSDLRWLEGDHEDPVALEDYEQIAGRRVDPAAEPPAPAELRTELAGVHPAPGWPGVPRSTDPGMATRVRETIMRTLRRAG